MTPRLVVVLCGPPGAGKTTVAHASGLAVYDRDDPQWTSEGMFTRAIGRLRTNPTARAVVIRSGATSTARHRAATLAGATHTYLVLAPQPECKRRVSERKRDQWRREVQGVVRWFTTYDQADGVQQFPGWDRLGPPSTPPPPTSNGRKASGIARGYGATHRKERARWERVVRSGRATCAKCGMPIRAGDPWDLGHTDDRTGWTGPEHPRCNRSAGGAIGNRRARERAQMVRRPWS